MKRSRRITKKLLKRAHRTPHGNWHEVVECDRPRRFLTLHEAYCADLVKEFQAATERNPPGWTSSETFEIPDHPGWFIFDEVTEATEEDWKRWTAEPPRA